MFDPQDHRCSFNEFLARMLIALSSSQRPCSDLGQVCFGPPDHHLPTRLRTSQKACPSSFRSTIGFYRYCKEGKDPSSHWSCCGWYGNLASRTNCSSTELLEVVTSFFLTISDLDSSAVKFDSEQLPEILNALETDNGGNKLILEVSVRATIIHTFRRINQF